MSDPLALTEDEQKNAIRLRTKQQIGQARNTATQAAQLKNAAIAALETDAVKSAFTTEELTALTTALG